ncbi:MAG: hypothetical protein ACRDGA_09085 [Bacteroidota bacterium]
MGLGQTMITAAFLTVLTIAILNANRLLVDSQLQSYSAVALDHAANFAQALLAEIGRKKFDHNELDDIYQLPTNFTATSALGPEAGESVTPWPDRDPWKSLSLYNDVDDYHGYARILDLNHLKGFKVTVRVYYVSSVDLNTQTSVQTYFKRIDASVEHPQFLPKVTFSSLATY